MIAERVFTVEEVNALVPELSRLVESQLLLQSEIEVMLAELSRLRASVPFTTEFDPGDASDVLELKREIARRITVYDCGWTRVGELGGVVKDPRIGMVDFYGQIDGRLVWLCWCYGEASVSYYHQLEAEHTGRQLVQGSQREALLN